MKIKLLLISLIALLITGCSKTPLNKGMERTMHNYSVYPAGIPYEDSLWDSPEYYYDESKNRTEANIKAIWIRSDYKDEESYAFAYLGFPENHSDKLPAVLLLHGGGGTSYWEWVKLWNDRGYIALAIDLEGHLPKESGRLTSFPNELYDKSEYLAPNNHNYNDASLPLEETWMYYATKTAIIANSFLHNLDNVDSTKVGVSGISWGGIITSIITGYDDRFAFSIPIYCTLNAIGSDSTIASYYTQNPDAIIWDSDEALSRVSTPIHFVVSSTDPNSRLDTVSKTLLRLKNASLTVIKDWPHSHANAVIALEPYAFADSVIKNEGLITFDSQPTEKGNEAELVIPTGLSVDSAIIVYSTDIININMSWSKRKVTVMGNSVEYQIPLGCTAFYLTITDCNGNSVSSQLVEIPQTN